MQLVALDCWFDLGYQLEPTCQRLNSCRIPRSFRFHLETEFSNASGPVPHCKSRLTCRTRLGFEIAFSELAALEAAFYK